jgi:hypothetical protein
MDYNANGVRDAGGFVAGTRVAATDSGVGSVAVSAYDATGALVASTMTAADGTYSLPVSGSATVRIEFGTPRGFAPTFVGSDSGTGVRFVAGDTAAAIDYGMTRGADYCQDNPKLVTCVMPYLANYPVDAPGAVALDSKLGQLTVSQRGASLGGTPGSGTTLTSPSAIGATWGVGVDRGGNAYFGTYVKRHSPYGPGSTGANGAANWIYKVDVATGTTTPWIRLGINTLPSHVATAPSGWSPYTADGYRSDNNLNDVFHLVGRAGLGDVDVTPDGSTLYAVEMTQADPKLWRVPIEGTGAGAEPGTAAAVSIPRPTSLDGVSCNGPWHPMGLGMTADEILVGGVCTVEKPRDPLTITTTRSVPGGSEGLSPGTSNLEITFADPHNLAVDDLVTMTSFVRQDGNCPLINGTGAAWSPSTNFFEVQSVPGATTIVVDTGEWGRDATGPLRCANLPASPTSGTVALFAGRQMSAFVLHYDAAAQTFSTRAAVELAYNKAVGAQGIDYSALYRYDEYGLSFYWAYKRLGVWRAWNDWDPLPGELSLAVQAQPMLANIEVNDRGDLVLGFRDRWLDQTTHSAVDYDSTPGSPQRSSSFAASADILVLCAAGDGYVREVNGACGSATGASMPDLLGAEIDPSVRPNSPLYYWNGYSPANHVYTGLGGLAMMPGARTLWTTAYDIADLNTQGVHALGPCLTRTGNGSCGPAGVDDGAITGGTRFSASISTTGCRDQCWGKGNGLGDLELLCDAAPVQIGNRVWIDANRNGIQDADEQPVAGVTVRLYDAMGALAGTAITDATGTYTFSSNVTTPAAGDGSNVGGGLVAGAAFTVKLDNPADYASGGPLAPYALTTADVATQGAAVNSKATLAGDYPTIRIPARQAGENNHTFDIGFAPPATPASSSEPTAPSALVAVGDYVWFDANGNGVQGKGEKPMRGAKVTLLTKDGKRARDAAGKLVPVKTTDAKGYYVFDGLVPGTYRVRFETPAGYTFTKVERVSSKAGSNPVVSTTNPRIAVTRPFRVYGEAKGDTVRNANPKVNAAFIDPTVDAGVVPQCTKYTFDKTLIYVGERVRVTVTAKLNGMLQRNRAVTLKGLGVHLTGRTNAKGQVGFWVEPEQGGLLVASSPGAMSGCTPQAVTVSTSMFPVTG